MNGKILRVKQGFNPNSSSMGSIIFALPVSLIAVSFTLAAASGVILPYFIKDGRPSDLPKEKGARESKRNP